MPDGIGWRRVWSLLALLMGLLMGCAPQYKTFVDYTPPESIKGMRCIMVCGEKREVCRAVSKRRTTDCLQEAREAAEPRLMLALERHARELRELRYKRDKVEDRLQRAQKKMRRCQYLLSELSGMQMRGDVSGGVYERQKSRCLEKEIMISQIEHKLRGLKDPSKPTLEMFTRSNHCQGLGDHCMPDHDQCFQLCGGKIRRETVCVRNCK
ncbi:MAG: hypothetical protein HQL53_02185 [Magnetococcales bacterium]|nr:hypothetical protein [Magnetococcales bacterium]